MEKLFETSFEYKLIYIFSIQDKEHEGLLKIGDATLKSDDTPDLLPANCKILNQAAMNRIKQYTNTAGISVNLLHTELAVRTVKAKNNELITKAFRDHNVHRVLENSGIKKENIKGSTSKEWFRTDLSTAVKAIDAVKKNLNNLSNSSRETTTPIVFRPEQKEAVEKTLKQFEHGNRMLWNAKMRFGKTLSALQVIKELQFKRSIIITHRPVVDAGWYEDFTKIFNEEEGNYIYGSKNSGYNVEELEKSGKNFVYFASMQDLRESKRVGGKYDKNELVFDLNWDFVIVDEAHEGTTTALGDDVIKKIIKEEDGYDTKFLALSGTPFNILRDYDEKSIYTWDYIMEQSQKHKWYEEHFGDSNPYEELPELKIFTYDLGKLIGKNNYIELDDKAFNFREFFRTWTGDVSIDGKVMPEGVEIGDFYHENDVKSFLNLITKDDPDSNYPYAKKEYRDLFRHSLWMLPGVKEAKALSKLMKNHPVFGMGFEIVNVAGEGDDEVPSNDALEMVRKAIKNAGNKGYTITLSCGKLTTGVTVPEWTAVMMLSGSYSTSAANYLQTIFRVQSPCNIDGKIKTSSYVFDFAPDRTLKMVAESVAISTKAGKTTGNDKVILGEFLNYCPVISIDGTKMNKYDTNRLLQQLKRAYAERAVQNGFDDTNIYNDELLRLDGVALEEFAKLKGIIGTSKSAHKSNDIDINRQGFTDEEYEEKERIEKKPVRERTPEEQARLDELKEKNKNKKDAISILRGISIRMPLLIYGADVPITEDVTIDKLTSLVDDSSWKEFMPYGVTKELFNTFIKYYDSEIFVSAGRKIRNVVKSADELTPLERVKKISELFSCFKNPDKETVLTPWRVVNMHMSDCLGGYKFYDRENKYNIEEPYFVDNGQVTADTVGNKDAKILEINSKTGLYPLYVAYSIYATKCKSYEKSELTAETQNMLWKETVENNIYIICKTPMAKCITKRTLSGFKNYNVNAHYFDDLANMMKNKPKQFIERIKKPSYWKREEMKEMKFDAIVGNPPYQENISSNEKNSSLSKQLFPAFVQTAIMTETKYVSLITPSRWFTGDAQDKSFVKLREYIRDNNHISKLYNYQNEREVFNNVEIKGGVNYFLYDNGYDGKVDFINCCDGNKKSVYRNLFEEGVDIIINNGEDYPILQKIRDDNFVPLTQITTGRNAFGIIGKQSVVDSISKKSKFEGCCELRCKANEIRYIKEDAVIKNKEIFNNYKVFISKSAGNPNSDFKIIGNPYIGEKKSACTDSLIPIGNFNNKYEALSLQKYIKTKFLRFLVSILKTSQNVTQIVYKFVPMQDFTEKSDIDWNKSIEEIDEQLYNKYNLTEEERRYINEKIKSMN